MIQYVFSNGEEFGAWTLRQCPIRDFRQICNHSLWLCSRARKERALSRKQSLRTAFNMSMSYAVWELKLRLREGLPSFVALRRLKGPLWRLQTFELVRHSSLQALQLMRLLYSKK